MKFLRAYRLNSVSLRAVIAAVILGGCATTGPAPEQAAPMAQVTAIDAREADGKTEIVIQADRPILQYTSFQLTEPLRLVVDMTDVDLGAFQNRIVVNKGAVIDVTPTQQDTIARLELLLSRQVESKVYQDSGRLVVELGGIKAAEVTAPTEKPAPAPAPKAEESLPEAPPAAEMKPASVVTGVTATATREGVKVVISGDGSLAPKIFPVQEGARIVVDLPGTRSRVRPAVIPVRRGGVDRVRVGQHGDPDRKVRVVLDLNRPLEYASRTEGNSVVLMLTSAAASEVKPETAKAPPAPLPQERDERLAALPEPQRESPAEQISEAVSDAPRYKGRKISLDFQDADLVNILRLFADIANFNMILSPEVRGKVTVRMVNVPWDQAMDIILKMNGLGMVREENVIRIAPVAALAREADEIAKAKESKRKAEDLITRIIPINYSTAAEVEGIIKKSLSARGETVVDARTNTLIVKDIARNVEDIVTLIRLLDKPIPQVMIEARIVEATTSFTRDIGVQWGGRYTASAATGNPTGLVFPNTINVTGGPTMGGTVSGSGNYLVNLPAAAGPGAGGAIGFSFGSLTKALNLDLVLSALESTGEGKVISTPRVSALDNKEAKIEQGQSIPYQSTSASGTQVQFIDAQLSLAVTPHVTPDNKIFMKIQAQKNAPDTSLLGAGGQPSIRKNQATTEILLSDGETAVIGGILIIDRGQTVQRVPFFADLPLIGWLFKKKVTRDDKRELLIFITPRIIRQETV